MRKLTVTKLEAANRSFSKDLTQLDIDDVMLYTDMVFDYLPAKRAYLIHSLLLQQHRTSEESVDVNHVTMVDLIAGRIAGSNYCPHCHGFMGRLDDFYTTNKENSDE